MERLKDPMPSFRTSKRITKRRSKPNAAHRAESVRATAFTIFLFFAWVTGVSFSPRPPGEESVGI
jgi:hypothetical protein